MITESLMIVNPSTVSAPPTVRFEDILSLGVSREVIFPIEYDLFELGNLAVSTMAGVDIPLDDPVKQFIIDMHLAV